MCAFRPSSAVIGTTPLSGLRFEILLRNKRHDRSFNNGSPELYICHIGEFSSIFHTVRFAFCLTVPNFPTETSFKTPSSISNHLDVSIMSLIALLNDLNTSSLGKLLIPLSAPEKMPTVAPPAIVSVTSSSLANLLFAKARSE